MRLLFDTHLLIWAAQGSPRLRRPMRSLIEADETQPVFSVASLWELAIKMSLPRSNLRIDIRLLRRGLVENGYEELPISGEHALAVQSLPDKHKDPFDRMLVAQALVEGMTLLTNDRALDGYPGSIRIV